MPDDRPPSLPPLPDDETRTLERATVPPVEEAEPATRGRRPDGGHGAGSGVPGTR